MNGVDSVIAAKHAAMFHVTVLWQAVFATTYVIVMMRSKKTTSAITAAKIHAIATCFR
jgi:hypothetical protein